MEQKQSNNSCFNFREVIWIILLILSVSYIGYKSFEKPTTNFNEKEYERKIDSLNLIITKNNKMNDSLELDNQKRLSKINDLNNQLTLLNKKAKYYEELYREKVDSLNHMSDNDVTKLFTDIFK
jgi:hypothetical protein